MTGSPFSITNGQDPYSVTVDPTGKFVYVANYMSHNISAFSIEAITGVLTEVTGSPFSITNGQNPYSVTVDPTGKFVYVANYTSHNISAFSIEATTGALKEVANSPFPLLSGGSLRSIVVDPTGKWVYATTKSTSSSNISAFSLDATTGALAEVKGSPFLLTISSEYAAVTVDPTGKWVYVASVGYFNGIFSSNLSTFSIDAATGVLTNMGSSVSGSSSNPVVTVDPSGKFVYVPSSLNSIALFSLDAKTGVLTRGVDSPFNILASYIYAMTVDPTGKFVYMVAYSSSKISIFSIDATAGALTHVVGSPFSATFKGGQPSSLAITGAIQ